MPRTLLLPRPLPLPRVIPWDRCWFHAEAAASFAARLASLALALSAFCFSSSFFRSSSARYLSMTSSQVTSPPLVTPCALREIAGRFTRSCAFRNSPNSTVLTRTPVITWPARSILRTARSPREEIIQLALSDRNWKVGKGWAVVRASFPFPVPCNRLIARSMSTDHNPAPSNDALI